MAYAEEMKKREREKFMAPLFLLTTPEGGGDFDRFVLRLRAPTFFSGIKREASALGSSVFHGPSRGEDRVSLKNIKF